MPKSWNRRNITVFSTIGLALLVISTLALVRERGPVITVQVETVQRRDLTELITANGKIQPVVEVKISPEVSGEIVDLPVKEGQHVQQGDLILKIRPDIYLAQRDQARASYESALAGKETAEADLRKAEAEFRRNADLFRNKLVSDSAFDEVRAADAVAKAQLDSAVDQVDVARANLASAEDLLSKTTIVSPLTGTISELNSRLGERVVGTATMAGTEVMTIANLDNMEARVEVGETDVVLIKPGQHVRLEVDAFKDRKFAGTVTDIADSAVISSNSPGASEGEATKFEVKVRIEDKAAFRPGMSVTAEFETRCHTNVLAVPIASVTTRLPREKNGHTSASGQARVSSTAKKDKARAASKPESTNALTVSATSAPGQTNETKPNPPPKPIEVVFVVENGRAKMQPVKTGISDDNYWEITDGLKEGQQVVSGGYRAISRDLEDGEKVRIGAPLGNEDESQGSRE